MTFAYISLLIILVLRILPPIGVVTLLTAPIAFTAMALTGKYHDRPLELCPANASTILIHFTTGGLISAVFVATRMMG
jgi:1,4-dihydroxy-2-naphthoate octaprenyltransferase